MMDKLDVLDQNVLLNILLKRMIEKNKNEVSDHLYSFDTFIDQLETQLVFTIINQRAT